MSESSVTLPYGVVKVHVAAKSGDICVNHGDVRSPRPKEGQVTRSDSAISLDDLLSIFDNIDGLPAI